MWQENLLPNITPDRVGSKSRWNIGKEAKRHDEKDFLDSPVGTFDDQPPESETSNGNNHVYSGSMRIICQYLDAGGNTKKFGHGYTGVSDQESQHGESGPAHAKLLANEVSQSFACDCPHACTHLLHNRQAETSNGQCPEEVKAIAGTCRRKGGDTTGIIARVGSDQPRPQYGKKPEYRRRTTQTKTRPRLLFAVSAAFDLMLRCFLACFIHEAHSQERRDARLFLT